MKHFYILLFTFVLFNCNKPKDKTDTVLVGASSFVINPSVGAFIAGDQRDRHFTGIHDSLFVKALALTDTHRNHFVILTFDCIGMLYPTLVEIRKAVSLQIPYTELDPTHIVMTSTHTHSGPDVVGIWGHDQMSTGVDSLYMESLIKISSDAIVKAWKNKKEASVFSAQTTFGEEWVYNISEPTELDRSVSILQFIDEQGKSIATLTNFACHPTIVDGVTSLVSSDYVSGFYTSMSHELGGENLFLQGSIGGWVQPEHEEKSFDRAEKRGRELGEVVRMVLKKSLRMENSDIHFKRKVIQLPVTNPGFRQLSEAGVINRTIGDSVQTEIAWFSLGSAQFVTHPGETVPAYSIQSKALMKMNGPKFVMGLGMDALGYILKPTFFDSALAIPHHEYLTGMSTGRETGPLLMKNITTLSNEK